MLRLILAPLLALTLASPQLLAAAKKSRYADLILADKPAAYWRLKDTDATTIQNLAPGKDAAALNGSVEGRVELQKLAQKQEQFPDFEPDGTAVQFGEKTGHIQVKDPGANSPLDFKKGESLTMEAWVSVSALKSGQMVYVIAKGRTGASGEKSQNQNYAMRLKGEGSVAHLAFLFRDADKPASKADGEAHWHRWTSETGFPTGGGWHHLALTYTFGKGDSLRGYIDSVPVTGTWDMGGKSDAAPIVDDDDLWIGSAMGGKLDATFHGLINEVALYHKTLSESDVKKRFNFVAPPPPAFSRDLPKGEVRVEIVENLGASGTWNFTAPLPVETYTVPAFGFTEVPQKYSAKGVREDRTSPFLLRASALVTLPKGEHRLLMRSLQSARLFVDDQQIALTPFIKARTDGHEPVPPMPQNLPDGLRFARMGHAETWATVKSDGREHLFVFEAFVGGKNMRADLGEMSVTVELRALASGTPPSRYVLLSPKKPIPHTDEGWTGFINERRAQLITMNARKRTEVAAEETKYWAMRHELARQSLAKIPALIVPAVSAAMPVQNHVDRFIGAKLDAAQVKPAPLADDFSFLRRLALDTVGVPPTTEQIREFVADKSPQRRANAIARFLKEPGWADHWVSYWQDVLAENPSILKPTLNNTGPFRFWIHESFTDNKPMDRFATELVMMEGSVYGGGPAGFGIASQNDVPMADRGQIVAQAFLGMNLMCARCHDAPYHDFKQKDLFSLAAMLKQDGEEVPKSSSIPPNANITVGRLVNVTLKPGEKVPPAWTLTKALNAPLPDGVVRDPKSHREELAAFITDPRNTRFAKVIVNRIWKRYLGWGLVEPVEDWETAKASHPELLEWLAREFMTHDYDFKHVASLILNSHAYQRVAGLHVPESDEPKDRLFASPARRRMTAEQAVDSLFAVVGKEFGTEVLTLDNDAVRSGKDFQNFGVPRRAWEFTGFANDRDRPALALPKAQAIADLLGTFGWRDARQNARNARDDSPNVLQPAALANGDMANARITRLSDDCALTEVAVKSQPLPALIDEVFLRVLSRPPTAEERELFVKELESGYEKRVLPAPPKSLKKEYDRTLQLSWSNHLNDKATDIKLESAKKIAKGDEPTPRLRTDWRERMEDSLWALVNTPEFLFVP
ncbi:MAG: DUF1553 domain-containing protein [Verrucomicrobia bacterium]|nr:DUF1553 domain-containing protein [Verrucomicrobiota bacterium]